MALVFPRRLKTAVDYDRKANLVGFWPMAEGGGLVARDATGHAGSLSLTAPTWGIGPWGEELVCNGSSTIAQLADSAKLETPTTQVTLIAAVTVTSNPSDGAIYAGKRSGFQDYTFGFKSRVWNSNTDTQALLKVGGTAYSTTVGSNSLSLNTPYILSLRWQSGDFLNIRVFDRHGHQVYDQNSTATISGSLTYDSGPFFVGYHVNNDSTGALFTPARFAFALLSSRRWSDNELQSFATKPFAGSTPAPRRVFTSAPVSLSTSGIAQWQGKPPPVIERESTVRVANDQSLLISPPVFSPDTWQPRLTPVYPDELRRSPLLRFGEPPSNIQALSGTIAATSSITGTLGSATSYSSVAAGAWETATNWSPNGVPGAGDSVTINHAITASTTKTVGPSGATGTSAIIVNSSGSLTVSGGTLTVRGDIVLDNATMTMDAGTSLVMDSSAAATPAATHYAIKIGQAHNQSSARLVINGTSGSRCSVSSNSSGGYAYLTDSGYLNGGLVTATYCDFARMGDSSNDNLFSANSSGTFSLSHCTFDACGRYTSSFNNSSDCSVTFQSCLWKNSTGTENLRILGNSSGSYASGTRLIDDCTFDKLLALYTPEHYTITNNQFYGGYDVTDAAWASFDGNLEYKTSATESPLAASVSNNYRVIDGSLTNPHFVQFRAYARDMTITGDVFEFTGTDGQGDCVLTPSTDPAATQTYTVTQCIMLKNGGSDNSGTAFTFFGAQPHVVLNFHHNTFYAGSQGAAVGETGGGYASSLTFRDNIGWDDAGVARGYLLYDSGTNDNVPDLVTAANADYNNAFDLLAGSNLKGYNNLEFSSGSPGAHDLAVDPQFTDAARRMATWDASLGGPGTVANAIAELKKKNDPTATYNANYTVSALLTYVKAGFAPKNQSLKNADHTGSGDIGAVAVAAVSNSLQGTIAAVSSITGTAYVTWALTGTIAAAASLSGTLYQAPATRSSFLIGTADIPLRAKIITPSLTLDDDHPLSNLFFGERERVAQLLTPSASEQAIVFTLGSGNGRKVEFLYLAQAAMLLTNGVTGVYLQGSNDNTNWTNILGRTSSLSGATLLGQDSRDLVFTSSFNDTVAGPIANQYTYWRLVITGGTSKRPLSKAFFGQWLDMGEPDTYDWEPLNSAADPWLYPRGNKLMSKTATERLKFTFEWNLVTDAKAEEFEQTLLKNSYRDQVLLYTQTNYKPLADRRLVHCKVVADECEINSVTTDLSGTNWNSVKAVFEELA